MHGTSAYGNEMNSHVAICFFLPLKCGLWAVRCQQRKFDRHELSKTMKSKSSPAPFLLGWRAHRAAFVFIRTNGLSYGFALAAAVTLIFVTLGFWAIQALHEQLGSWVEPILLQTFGIPDDTLESVGWFKEWMHKLSLFTLDVMFWVVMFWIKIKTTKYLVLMSLGPLMAWISERSESILLDLDRPFVIRVWLWELFRGLGSALLLFSIEISLGLMLLFSSVFIGLMIPGFAVILVPLISIIGAIASAWFYGASVYDYLWERKKLGVLEGLAMSWKHRSMVFGVGLPFYLWMSIPVISWFVSPVFAPIICSVAAVMAWGNRSNLRVALK